MDNIRVKDATYIAGTYARQDVCFVKGAGSYLYDESGKEYIDLGSGIGVTAFGHADAMWAAAVKAQVDTLSHVSNLYHTLPQVELAEKLCAKTGMKKVFFSNSGAEANECAIKATRKYSVDKYGKERNVILTMENSFHGRTLATLSATGQESMHTHFYPFVEGFLHIPANDIEAFYTAASKENVCAVMFEPILGESGVNPLEESYVKAVTAFAEEHDLLVVVDEVQTGNGRTGTLYGYMHFGIEPDIVSTAKGLAGGLPLGATMFNEKTEGVLTTGTHGSTFGGNPVSAAGAVTIVDRLDDALLQAVAEKGEYVVDALTDSPGVVNVTGLGLMLGIEIEGDAKAVIRECLAHGVVVLSAKEKLRLLPALNIPQVALERAVGILKQVIAEAVPK